MTILNPSVFVLLVSFFMMDISDILTLAGLMGTGFITGTCNMCAVPLSSSYCTMPFCQGTCIPPNATSVSGFEWPLSTHNIDARLFNWNVIPFARVRQKPRGTRAGRKKQRPIHPIITPCRAAPFHADRPTGSDHRNLTVVSPVNTPSTRLTLASPLQSISDIQIEVGQAINQRISSPHITDTQFEVQKTSDICAARSKTVSVGSLNTQSCRNKTHIIRDMVEQHDIDILFMTETWLKNKGDEALIEDIKPLGYDFANYPRENGKGGGGIAVMFKSSIGRIFAAPSNAIPMKTFECIKTTLQLKGRSLNIYCIYRPPPSKKNQLKTSEFLKEIEDFVPSINIENQYNIFVGDFNIHFEKDTSVVNHIKNLLEEQEMEQYVTGATQRSGHTIDWLVGNIHVPLTSVKNINNLVSDHNLITFVLPTDKPLPQKVKIKSRDWRNINLEQLKRDLHEQFSAENEVSAEQLQHGVERVIETHAPQTERLINVRKSSPWFNSNVKEAKRKKRSAEAKWRKTQLTVHREIYKEQKRLFSRTCFETKKEFYNSKFSKVNTSKEFFGLCNELMGKGKSKKLPSQIEKSELPNAFVNYFDDKIKTIRQKLDDEFDRDHHLDGNETFSGDKKLRSFDVTSEKEISEIVFSSKSKCCELDPIPTTILKPCLISLLPIITDIMNESLSSGCVPDIYKTAIVKPLLKKANLDPENLKNYRPVSNLRFLSKVLEKLVLKRLCKHLEENNLLEIFQSAYKPHHSTETALACVANDLIRLLDNGSVSLLSVLDLSAAFDTIDHKILIDRLHYMYGIDGIALEWFVSYLSGRSQAVLINSVLSESHNLSFGVPQGSVLGPVLFILYTAPLSNVIKYHGLSYHFYADDSQLYSVNNTKDYVPVLNQTELCVMDVKRWMDANKLKMNEEKTEVLIIGRKNQLEANLNLEVEIGENIIESVNAIKTLGVYFDSKMDMEKQVNALCKALFFELRKIASIRPFISTETAKTLVSSLIFSRLDYCNSLLFGLPQRQIQRLQRFQNCAARLVLRKRKSDDAFPLLRQLHWLPVERRILFKAACMTFKCINGLAPSYLSDHVVPYIPGRANLRSCNDRTKLIIPKTKTKLGERAFSCFGPSTWNSLPRDLRDSPSIEIFKKKLKTHLFKS